MTHKKYLAQRSVLCRLLVFVALAWSTGSSKSLSGQVFSPEPKIDQLVASAISKNDIPGMSLAVVKDGRIVYAKGFGTTSLTAERRPSGDTQYRIASVSKPLTATGVFQLV